MMQAKGSENGISPFRRPAPPGCELIIRGVRPLIGRQHLLGHGVIDSDHQAIADWWLQMLLSLCDQAGGLSRFNWKKERSLLRTKLPKLVREHNISMDQLTVLFINTNGKIAAC